MSLATALNIAQQSLLSTSRQTSVVSRNVTNAGNPDYARRDAIISSEAPGARVVVIQRAANASIFRANMQAISAYEAQGQLRASINNLATAVNGVDNSHSAAKALGSLYEALHLYGANPSNSTLAGTAIEAAREVVRSLNEGSAAINAARAETDMQISVAVEDLNRLLAEFHANNKEIVGGTAAGRDVSDALDRRDHLLKSIAQYVPVSTISRENNDMMLLTASSATLFETTPRSVTFVPTPGYAAGTTGNSVMVDGVGLPVGVGADTSAGGRIAALMQMRDSVAPTLQAQLDEIARGLVTAFAEVDQSGGSLPSLAGLFTWSGGPALPAAGTLSHGIAGSIAINALVDPLAGGNPSLLRDGGINGINYVANVAGSASFSALLIGYGDRMDAAMAFDPVAGAGASGSLLAYSSSSVSWLEAQRQSATKAADTKAALLTRTAEALSNETGVNIDEELARMLELERSYEASARLIRAVDEMLATLLAAVR